MQTAEVNRAGVDHAGRVVLQCSNAVADIVAERIVLATGFEPTRPGGQWLDRAIARLGLVCAGCGYPVVDRTLCWHPGIYVTGPLAELEIGPAAPNIAGARMAAERIARVAGMAR